MNYANMCGKDLPSKVYEVFFNKRTSLVSSFVLTIGFHAIVLLIAAIVLTNVIEDTGVTNMPISENQQIAVPQFIEFVLKDFLFEPTEDDVIELIKKEIEVPVIEEPEPEPEPIPEEIPMAFEETPAVEAVEKSTSFVETAPITKALGVEIKQTYISQVVAKLARNKYYPKAEQNRGREGSVKVRFTIEPNGSVKNLMVHTPSRYANLDKAALETVNRSSPFPAFDATEPLEIILSIDFSLED